ncbi:hypothetical protein DFH29DRAFT_1006616 [Suillus ampliporus]|nr:hypothetical protein DFH29DRAFT_1006616 [Suillus ampliporus]
MTSERQLQPRTTTTTLVATQANDVEGLKTRLNNSKRHVVQLQHDNEQLATATAALESEIEGLKIQLSESKRHTAQLKSEHERLQTQDAATAVMQSEVDVLKTKLYDSQRHAAQLQNDNVKGLKDQLSESNRRTAELEETKEFLWRERQSRMVREATPVTSAPSNVSAPHPIGSQCLVDPETQAFSVG